MNFLDLLSILHKDPSLIKKLSGQETSDNNLQPDPETIWGSAILISTAFNNKEHVEAYNKFNEFYKSIMSDNKDLETVLQSHFLIEFYIRKFINLCIGDQFNYKKLPKRFNFASMIEILKCIKELSIRPWLKSLTELNKIRNEYAHNISYKVRSNDVKEICKFIEFRKSLGSYMDSTVLSKINLHFV